MNYVIPISVVVLGLVGKRKYHIYFVLILIFIVTFGLNTYNPDFANYYNAYNSINSYTGKMEEPVFLASMKTLSALGCSYQTYLVCVSTIFVITLSIMVWKLSPNPSLVMLLYFFYPFTLDITQCRNTLSLSFVLIGILLALKYLENRDNRFMLGFFGLILVATLTHYSSILYIVISIMFMKRRKWRKLALLLIVVATIGTVLLLPSLVPFISIFIGSFKASWFRSLNNLTLGRRATSIFVRITPFILCIALFKLSPNQQHYPYQSCSDNVGNRWFSVKTRYLFETMQMVAVISILEVLVSTVFERQGRIAVLLFYILATRIIYLSPKINHSFCYAALVIGFIIMFSYYMFMSPGEYMWFDNVFLNIINNNLLFQT